MVVGFTRVCPESRGVYSGSLGSLGYALIVVGFVRGRSVHLGAPFWVVRFIRGFWVRTGAPRV